MFFDFNVLAKTRRNHNFKIRPKKYHIVFVRNKCNTLLSLNIFFTHVSRYAFFFQSFSEVLQTRWIVWNLPSAILALIGKVPGLSLADFGLTLSCRVLSP